jgi:hypothetical protein
MVVLAAQLLLIAMSIGWCAQLTLIAVQGETCFTETNAGILYGEISATVLVALFGVLVFVIQYRRLTEKRISDGRQQGKQGSQRSSGLLNP